MGNISLVLAISDRRALTKYRLGWATGDTEIIMSVVNNASYTFTWLPNNNVVSARDFPQFFEGFKKRSTVPCTRLEIGLLTDLAAALTSTSPRTDWSAGRLPRSLSSSLNLRSEGKHF